MSFVTLKHFSFSALVNYDCVYNRNRENLPRMFHKELCNLK